jgi:ABC-type sugar transport system permease subunit
VSGVRESPGARLARSERRLALALLLPALAAIALVAAFPLAATAWESLHRHDLRMPWLGRPFVALANYGELLSDPRFGEALAHSAFFTAVSVALEVALGLALALALDRRFRGRGLARTAVLLPWAVPSVVAALVWRFMFEGDGGIVNALLARPVPWLADARAAWLPLVLADVWKTTPFVALLLLAGLQTVDPALHEAARIDGAGAWRRFREITLPLLAPALAVATLFRALDAFRVFDVVYVMTGGGPGTATEPVSLYAFDVLFRSLRFGYGSAISMTVFLGAFLIALGAIALLGPRLVPERER